MTSPEAPTDAPPATPSLRASLSALGVMVAAILLSVALFGGEVDAGPLQVAMTLGLAAAVLRWARTSARLIIASAATTTGFIGVRGVQHIRDRRACLTRASRRGQQGCTPDTVSTARQQRITNSSHVSPGQGPTGGSRNFRFPS